MEKVELNISWKTLWQVLLLVVFVIALYYTRNVLGMLLVAIILSSALNGPVTYLEKKKIPRILSVLAIYLVGAAILALLLYAVVPVALIQLKYFLTHLNDLKIPFLDIFGSSVIVSQIDQGITNLINTLFYGSQNFSNFFSTFIKDLFFVGVSLVLSFYLTLSKDGVERFIRSILPSDKEEMAVNLYLRTRRKLSRWLSGQIILSLIIGFLTFLGLVILGIDYALVLSLLAAVLELIPYVGPIAVGTIVFLISLPQSVTVALLAVLVFFIIQQLEGHFLVPVVMSKAIGTDPIVILISMLAGGEIAGVIGVLVAVPVSIVFQEIIEEWNFHKYQIKQKVS